MRLSFILGLFLFSVAVRAADWQLLWSDEFDGDSLDSTKWSYEVDCWGGGNGELQCYTARPDNVRIENGNLILEAKREVGYLGTTEGCTRQDSCLGPKDYTSGRIRTATHPDGSWLHGKFEMKARLPKGKHLWPAFWMLPTDYVYGTWAASGEIDIMEYRGQSPNDVQGTLHHSSEWPNNRYTTSDPVTFESDFSEDFHVFSLEWEKDSMRWYVDDQQFFEQNLDKNWWEGGGRNPYTANGQPWDQKFHIILNLAIGGAFFNGMGDLSPDDVINTWTQTAMIVDYVRVYHDASINETTTESTVDDTPVNEEWGLVWSDEFSGDSIDLSKWSFEVDCWGGGNGEAQCYTARSENARIENGALVIEAKHEPGYPGTNNNCTHPGGCVGPKDYTSARLRTLGPDTGSWKYGRFEANIQLPKGNFLWPAFWMLPTDNVYGTWAASGEIDIMEYRGQHVDRVEGTVHHGGAWPNNRYTGSGPVTVPYDLSSEFHVFAIEWDKDTMKWFVDDEKFHEQNLDRSWWSGVGDNPYTENRQPFDQRFHILVNLAIGGGFFSGMGQFSDSDVQTWTNPTMKIDYVRVYQRDSDSKTTISVNSEADSYVRGGIYNMENYGNLTTMQVQQSDSENSTTEVFIRFNLETVPKNKNLTSAVLNLTIANVDTNGSATLNVDVVRCWWDEDQITWSDKPSSIPFTTVEVTEDSNHISVDLTNAVSASMKRDNRLHLRLHFNSTNSPNVTLFTREAQNNSSAPVLLLTLKDQVINSNATQTRNSIHPTVIPQPASRKRYTRLIRKEEDMDNSGNFLAAVATTTLVLIGFLLNH